MIVIGTLAPVAARGVAKAYAKVLARYGAGTFSDFFHVLRPEHTSTYGERLGMEDDAVLVKHVVFADSENGDALSYVGDAIYRFPPRSFEPVRVRGDLLALLGSAATPPFFVPDAPRTRWTDRRKGERVDFDGAIASLRGTANVLARASGEDWESCTLHVLACEGIARFQWAAGFWQTRFDAPEGTKRSAFAAAEAAFTVAKGREGSRRLAGRNRDPR